MPTLLAALLLSPAARAAGCETVTFADIVAVEAPAVVVLGERYGTQPDLRRADRVVGRLQTKAPVTLALEAIRPEYQLVLDQFAENGGKPTDIPALVGWEANWGFPFGPYEQLVTASSYGVEVVGVGLPFEPRPEDAQVPLPPSYMSMLRDAIAHQDLPVEQESRFVQAMAWRDWSIANTAIQAWDGEGYLVILTGRAHVEGGKGVPWQAQLVTDKPVHAFVLSWADPPCFPGDKVWKPGLFETK